MRIVIQRVSHASVTINSQEQSAIGQGLLILLGIGSEDTIEDADWLVKKVATLRIFNDANNVMNLSVKDICGEVLVVSQFTLMASYKKGNRPSYIHAAPHELSIPLYEHFCRQLSQSSEKMLPQVSSVPI